VNSRLILREKKRGGGKFAHGEGSSCTVLLFGRGGIQEEGVRIEVPSFRKSVLGSMSTKGPPVIS